MHHQYAAAARLLLVALLAAAVAAGPPVPSLFTELPDAVTAASAINVQAVLPGVDLVSFAGSKAPAVKVTGINKVMLAAQPPKLQLDLPNVAKPITITARRDLSQAALSDGPSEAQVASAAAAGFDEVVRPNIYVGEVAGSPGALSTVVLVTSESGAVYGDIRYYDRKARRIRSFKVVPEIDKTQVSEEVLAANADATPDLYPKINTKKYIVVEYKEPRGDRKFVVPDADSDTVVAAAAATSTSNGDGPLTVNTTPKGPVKPLTSEPLPGFNALDKPFPTPQELEAAKAATAGPTVADADAAAAAAFVAAAAAADIPVNTTTDVPTLLTTQSTNTAPGSGRRKLLQTTVTQDVLIVYTAAAASRVGGVDAMNAKARENVARTNKAYVDSGINVQLNVVAIRQTPWSEAGKVNTPTTPPCLGDLQAGRVTNVHAWRDEFGADLVALFDDVDGISADGRSRTCGWGYIAGNSNQAHLAFSEVLRNCYDGFTFAHELGHNQGCGHLSGDGSSARATYAYGWRRCDLGTNNFKTIMAGWCSPVTEAGMFATPSRSFRNVAPAGNANTGDCARNIRETGTVVGAYRATRTPTPPTNNNLVIRLQNLNPNKCVDAPSYNNGARVLVWDCHGGQNQQWELLADGSVRAVGTNKCLDVAGVGTADGTGVTVWDCWGGNNQKWSLDAWGRLHPYHAAHMCLDVPGGGTQNGNQMQIWNCQTNKNNQVFSAPSLGTAWNPGGRGIKSRLNNMCIDVFAYTYQNGGPVVTWPCNNQANQQWFTDSSGGLRSQHNMNFCLDASSNDLGATVYIFGCHWGGNQRWFLDPLGRLRPYSNPNRCLDIRGANPAQQTPLQLWDCLDVNQQKWYL